MGVKVSSSWNLRAPSRVSPAKTASSMSGWKDCEKTVALAMATESTTVQGSGHQAGSMRSNSAGRTMPFAPRFMSSRPAFTPAAKALMIATISG